MTIDVRWEDENGEELARVSEDLKDFARIIPESTSPDYPCLRYIDPYGDTTFNQLQLPQLLKDLEKISSGSTSAEQKTHINRVIEFVTRACGETHTYIKFYGD